MNYLKVMFETKSGASDFEYKVDSVNVANFWNPEEKDPKKMGGFSFSIESKILRWLVRGDTLYDVTIPEGTEVYDCENPSTPHGVFRAEKIIISNPRKVTDDMAMDFYLKSDIPEISYFKAMAGVAIRGYINTALRILEDKVDLDNVPIAISEFEDFCKMGDKDFDEKRHLGENTRIIYNKMKEMLKQIKEI